MENPIKIDDLGVYTIIFGNTHIENHPPNKKMGKTWIKNTTILKRTNHPKNIGSYICIIWFYTEPPFGGLAVTKIFYKTKMMDSLFEERGERQVFVKQPTLKGRKKFSES